jgi:signal transduction histidine kinase
MICPKPHDEEKSRQQSLEEFAILDSIREPEYDEITALAAKITGSPMALLGLLDENRQWFKATYGLDMTETLRKYSFCGHTINSTEDILIVQDARIDPRFCDNPFVKDKPYMVFYAGLPLLDDHKLPLGTLCVIDTKPKQLKDSEIDSLRFLAKQIMVLFKKRKIQLGLNVTLHKLKERNNDLEHFALDIAHDIKTPLNNISSICDYLIKNYQTSIDEEGQTLLSLIQSSSTKLKSLIEDTLEYYRDGSKIQEEISPIELESFFDEILKLFNDKTGLKLKIKTSLKIITFNKSVLQHIMTNLFCNAVRYNDKKITQLEVGVFQSPQFLEFYVQDNGPGIPVDLHKKIFDLFTVGQIIDNKGEKGKGIGLATVKKLVENLGGTIWVENVAEGGSRFTFKVPNILKPLLLN